MLIVLAPLLRICLQPRGVLPGGQTLRYPRAPHKTLLLGPNMGKVTSEGNPSPLKDLPGRSQFLKMETVQKTGREGA